MSECNHDFHYLIADEYKCEKCKKCADYDDVIDHYKSQLEQVTKERDELKQETVFEIIDQTSEEMYYPLGIFETLPLAIADIQNRLDNDEQISEDCEEYEIIEVKERKIGWQAFGKTVYKVERERKFSEDDSDVMWTNTITPKATSEGVKAE